MSTILQIDVALVHEDDTFRYFVKQKTRLKSNIEFLRDDFIAKLSA